MRIPSRTYHFLFLLMVFTILFGCFPTLDEEAAKPDEALTRIHHFYPKFNDDMDMASLARAIERDLEYLNRINPDRIFQYGPDSFTCRQVKESQEAFLALIRKNPDTKTLNRQIEKNFRVYRAAGRVGNNSVLFTGYFEPLYQGSLQPDSVYRYPLYKKPDDLITIDLSPFRDEFKGRRIVARIEGKKVLPYFSKHQIDVEKALEGRGLEVAWLKDPLDVTFLHIQGSGRLKLPDGSTVPVGYRASNGRPYRSIGRYLIDNGYMNRDEVSMQSIRKFLKSHPDTMQEVLNHNPSYVFFDILKRGPLGNINVPLTPGRSIALDARLFPKGALCFISCEKPVVGSRGNITGWKGFSRFTLNQDTGGAIKGAGRADIFWGNGMYARVAAGHLKHDGLLYVLIKKPPGD
jgi:membrane-bound lytic murein transglycosylase A